MLAACEEGTRRSTEQKRKGKSEGRMEDFSQKTPRGALLLLSFAFCRLGEKHALRRLAAPRRGRRCGGSSSTDVLSLFVYVDDDGSFIVDRARRAGVDEFSELVDFDGSVVDIVGALAAPGRCLALRGLPALFGAIARCRRLRDVPQSRLDGSTDSRRRWLRLGERECESVFEFFGVGVGIVDDD